MRRLLVECALSLACLCGLAGCQSARVVHGFTQAQVTVLRGTGFHEGPGDWEMDFAERILFETDSDTLDAHARDVVERIGRALHGVGVQRVRVEGHADSTGGEGYNRMLSLRRARAVVGPLVAGGLPEGGVEAFGLGSSTPVAGNESEAGRAGNRRVAIIVPVP